MANIKKSALIISGLVIALVFAVRLADAVPKTMSYQGKLMDSSGTAQTRSFDFKFAIYEVSSGGTSIWPLASEDTHTGVEVKDGLYNVELGIKNPIDAKFDKDYWLEIQVSPNGLGTYETLYPRNKLTTSAYAFKCEYGPPGTMVLLYTVETDSTGIVNATAQRSYTLVTNSYARILTIAEVGIVEIGIVDSNWTFQIKYGGVSIESMNLIQKGDIAGDEGITYSSISISQAYTAGGTISLDITGSGGSWYVKSFRVYGIY